jgi:tRNA nucleotidyltransferase/poly(A) polymerase
VPELNPDRQREFALEVLTRLRQGGFEAYWAGGCVRDCLLDRRPKDYDVATNATPPEIRELFAGRPTLEIGAAFGVVAVVGPKPAGMVEVTTFRHDAQYSDGRRPDAVEFTSAEEDAKRRDFTINGLFYDPLQSDPERRVIDFVGGVADLQRKLVRAIGDPQARFGEDKLRLLRAVRIAATFDFALEEATHAAIVEFAPTVTAVSPERIAQELRLMLVNAHRARAAELLRETGLLAAILPEAAENLPDDSWRQTLAMLERLSRPGFPLALATLLGGLAGPPAGPHPNPLPKGEGARAEEIGRRWRLSNKEIERTRWLVEHRAALAPACSMPWPRLQRLLISEGIDDLIALHEAAALARGADLEHVRRCRELLRLPASELDPPPLVTGDDLIRHGIASGKQFKPLLEMLRDAQLEQRVADKQAALALADRLLAEGLDR